ncbi:hypothetical protein PV328_006175 [Microctonus aethiopoides]|uniref:Aminopeptidase n=2 Tax=Microctonus aethiopoides TaxID=144406 RepID=A0AA39FP21_9HYME|nr:hypothetical protein PV328_006175 [Microctonus aethiopoides]
MRIYNSKICSAFSRILIDKVVPIFGKYYSTTGTKLNLQLIMATTEKKQFQRLPTNIRPRHYEITLIPDMKNFIFDGTQNVDIEVNESTDTIVLNSLDIDIKNVTFKNGNTGNDIVAEKIDVSVADETATLTFPEKLPVSKNGTLHFNFVGEINDKMKGLYRSKYQGSTIRKTEAVAITFLCPTSARRVFPCWDEPTIKATFSLTLVLQSCDNVIGVSNMPVANSEENENVEVLKFEKTPVMSTYLVAVVVGEFDYVEDQTSDGTVVRVYTPKEKREQGRFALEVATKVLPYYNKYFGISYPLPKMDLIAIADFAAGAMENWGLVTYRETCLLVDPQNTSAASKQWIALVVGHELAHQWFGNLVTMEWWTHLWLNEGYASFVEFLCVAHLFPEYDIWTQFVTDTYIKALELDGLKNSHPIEVPVGHPTEIDEIFDDISYNKGASVIRMLHSYIGDSDFRKGMNLYLKRHSYANAETEDLWNALEETSNKPIGAIMSTWTKQQGFPVIKVEQRQEGNNRILSLSQERFLADGSHDEESSLWMIPVSVSTSTAPSEIAFSTIMREKNEEIVINNVPKDAWIKVNPGTIGFYRTRYNFDALALLMPAVKNRTLPPLDRLGLLDDLFAMVQAGHVSTVEALKFMQAYQYEDNYTVWSSIVSSLSKIGILLGHHDDLDQRFKKFGRSLLKDIANKLGWEPKKNESHLDNLLRSLVLGRMSALNDLETIEEAKKRFELHISGKCILPADLRSPVYRAVLSVGDVNTYEAMLKLYDEADLHEEKDRILRALGAIRDKQLLGKVLDFAMSDKVRAQDTVFAIMSVAFNSKGRDIAWEFLKSNWQILTNRYGAFLLPRLVKHTTENFVTEQRAIEIEEFFKKNPTPGTERTVQQSVESIRLNVAWLARDQAAIEHFLK